MKKFKILTKVPEKILKAYKNSQQQEKIPAKKLFKPKKETLEACPKFLKPTKKNFLKAKENTRRTKTPKLEKIF